MYVYFVVLFLHLQVDRPLIPLLHQKQGILGHVCMCPVRLSCLRSSSGSHQHLSKTTLFTIELVKITTNDGIRAGHR